MPIGGSEGVLVNCVKCGVFLGLRGLGLVLSVLAFLVPVIGAAHAEDRTISMFNIHTKETIKIVYKRDGKFVPEALQTINHFMRDWRLNQEIKMDPGLVDLIWELHHELGSKEPVHLICGYRSSGTNEMLRHTSGGQARNSRHITGQAADILMPDVPLKQVRYSALMHERGGVGYYPASGLPFVHVDTGNVRHWPRMGRTELAMLFPSGHSLHVPTDGRPLTLADFRVASARAESLGLDRPWSLTRRTAGPVFASLGGMDDNPLLQRASLSGPAPEPFRPAPVAPKEVAKPAAPVAAALANLNPNPVSKPESVVEIPEAPEPLLAEEGEEQEDLLDFEPLPATFLLAEKPLSYSDIPDAQDRPPVFKKIGLLMQPASVLTSEDFDHRLQIEDLYEANSFQGRAVAFAGRLKARMAAALMSKAKAKQASLR
jgi:uncharacterized protein YcbK (DUF882 family)